MSAVLNISSYLFVPLTDTLALRESIRSQAAGLSLKGTVLLAEEGINLFLAGSAESVRGFVAWLKQDKRFAPLEPKESWSDHVPFGKLLVKVKREIIRMNHPTIRPHAGRAPAVDAKTLARWLDAGVDDDGRPVVTLDTRNAFEVGYGKFRNAIDWNIAKFTEFPQQVAEHRNELAGKRVVSYCTGGIRCEKAAIYMAEAGIEHVVQLEGGILKYFEEVGGQHYEGGCFVFDERESLAPSLAPAPQLLSAPSTSE
ncbi:sulfurtransferase [Piscinibacter gummiphilus]|uniref:tRNA uridine(34) hydroxylase n=1 Tax=Piscinibacter gummiphilus TaxID=946333 RepID=A0ABZ0CP54_9BURK|nr:sulfurtransferase [Piscinibacter gummiphilus]WOB06755.1 sulfurtransferase [Piscinibacter gummiphilus]